MIVGGRVACRFYEINHLLLFLPQLSFELWYIDRI